MATITALNIYPVKSCRGIALERATTGPMGLRHDREWMIVYEGLFITQREEPRLALIQTAVADDALTLDAPESSPLMVSGHSDRMIEVTMRRDKFAAFDAGDDAARWLQAYLGKPYRLVHFDPRHQRQSSTEWTKGVTALNQFSDGYPYLVISQASLDDLNRRLAQPLPMNRFRPNIVVDGLPPYGEDHVHEFSTGEVRLRVVKSCTRCVITTTDQMSGTRQGDEPIRTLRSYRLSREPAGVIFGQNVILIEGVGRELRVGQELRVDWKS